MGCFRRPHSTYKKVVQGKCPLHFFLSGPISRDNAIVSVRYPLSRDYFLSHPSNPPTGCDTPLGVLFYTDISVRYPILQHIARYLCDTPGKQARKSFAIISLKVSRDMKSIAAGPLRFLHFNENNLFLNTSALTMLRTNFLSALCGLPTVGPGLQHIQLSLAPSQVLYFQHSQYKLFDMEAPFLVLLAQTLFILSPLVLFASALLGKPQTTIDFSGRA